MNTAQLTTHETVRRFLLAGDATLTLVSKKTGARFTYRVRQPDAPEGQPPKDIWFVSVLSGPDNEGDYAYMGQVWPPRGYSAFTKERLEYAHGRKSKISPSAPSAQAFAWFARKVLLEQRLPDSLEVWHEGRCCRCGRKLTVPESIAAGIGPECAGVMGVDIGRPARARSQPRVLKAVAAGRDPLPFNDDIPFGGDDENFPHFNDEGNC